MVDNTLPVGVFMINQCANPNCSKLLHYLREGRIFAFDMPDPRGPVISGRVARRREHYWLCGDCMQSHVVVQSGETGVRVVPRNVAPATTEAVVTSRRLPGALTSIIFRQERSAQRVAQEEEDMATTQGMD